MQVRLLSAAAVVLAITLAGCTAPGGGTNGSGGSGSNTLNLTITAGNLLFQPDSITVKAGDQVHLTVVNQDMFHTFTIDELGINFNLPAGETKTFDFVASRSGTFSFYCAVPGHREAGMHGTLRAS